MSANESETEMTEQTYTREDMARAVEDAYAWGWHDAWAQEWSRHRRDIGPLDRLRAQQVNPYREQEES